MSGLPGVRPLNSRSLQANKCDGGLGGGGGDPLGGGMPQLVNPIPPSLQHLLTQLEFFAMLETDKKPNVRSMTFSDAHSLWDSLYRSWTGECKEDVVQSVRTVVNEALDALDDYQNTDFIYILLEKLRQFRRGVLTLLETYKDHPKVTASIRVIIDNVDLNLQKQQDHLNARSSSAARAAALDIPTVMCTRVRQFSPPSVYSHSHDRRGMSVPSSSSSAACTHDSSFEA